jgi:beta-glucosidase
VLVKVENTGKIAGDEVVQLYLKDEKASTPRPKHQLEGFKRIHLQPGESKIVEFDITPRQFSIIGNEDKRVIESGWFTIWVGGGQPQVANASALKGRIQLTGKNIFIE